MNQEKLTFLGTGNAFVTHIYNTCFLLSWGEGKRLLVDAGGGNGILARLEEAGIALTSLSHLYLTNAHTDHVLGAVWVVRAVVNAAKDGLYPGAFHIYGHERVLSVLRSICALTLAPKDQKVMAEHLCLHELRSGKPFMVEEQQFIPFDILSTKEKQFGFSVTLPSGKRLVCLGDEPYNEVNRPYAQGADWLLSEAFCLDEDKEIFHPYQKNHSTARDAALLAGELAVKNLVLYHTEDHTISTRRERYRAEAQPLCEARVWVPQDLEEIAL